jgi:hypothetical protein
MRRACAGCVAGGLLPLASQLLHDAVQLLRLLASGIWGVTCASARTLSSKC